MTRTMCDSDRPMRATDGIGGESPAPDRRGVPAFEGAMRTPLAGSRPRRPIRAGARRTERGFSLVETLIGLAILLVVAAGVLPLGLLAISISENHGHLMARSAEYAQDKLEQLMALSYGDSVTDTRHFPAQATGGTGLAPGGSVNTAAPVTGYVDYLDITGTLLAPGTSAPANWYYQRVWRVEDVGTGLKRITVTARVRTAAQGGHGITPRATVAALKTFPF